MSEMAIISARKARLQHLSERGNKNAFIALQVAKNPNDFLSTVQIGITLVGILAGAIGGATISRHLEVLLSSIPLLAPFGGTFSLAIVVLGITFLSLVVGELVPKRLALTKPEEIAYFIARPMQALSRLARPAVWILSTSTEFILKLIRASRQNDASISEDEIKILVKQAEQTGILSGSEKEMIHRVILLGDRRVSSIMTQRGDIEWLDLNDSEEVNRRKVLESTHYYFPVGQKRLSNFLGIASTKNLLIHNCETKQFDIKANLNQAIFVPESMKALTVLEQFKKSRVQFAVVVDEYGGIAGLITLNNILEAIVGDIQTSEESEDKSILKREDGSWLVDGMFNINEFVEYFPIRDVMQNILDYNTVAGFLLTKLGRIPDTGDVIKIDDYLFEIVDMDGKRIDKILISSVPK